MHFGHILTPSNNNNQFFHHRPWVSCSQNHQKAAKRPSAVSVCVMSLCSSVQRELSTSSDVWSQLNVFQMENLCLSNRKCTEASLRGKRLGIPHLRALDRITRQLCVYKDVCLWFPVTPLICVYSRLLISFCTIYLFVCCWTNTLTSSSMCLSCLLQMLSVSGSVFSFAIKQKQGTFTTK